MGEEELAGQDEQPDEEQTFDHETFWRLHHAANIFIGCLLFNLNRDFYLFQLPLPSPCGFASVTPCLLEPS